MDFCRGPADVANGVLGLSNSVLTNEQSLHLTEISLTMQYPDQMGHLRELESRCSKLKFE